MRTQQGHNNTREAFARESENRQPHPPSRQQRSRTKARQLPDCDEVCRSMSGTRVYAAVGGFVAIGCITGVECILGGARWLKTRRTGRLPRVHLTFWA